MSLETALVAATKTVAVDAVYYLTRLIRHRAGSMRKLVVEGITNEPSAEAVTLAGKLADEVEQEKGTPLEDLNEESVREIISRLEQLAKEVSQEGIQVDGERGKTLLQQLRSSDR